MLINWVRGFDNPCAQTIKWRNSGHSNRFAELSQFWPVVALSISSQDAMHKACRSMTVGRTSVPFSRITTGLPWLSLAIIWQSLVDSALDHSGPQGTPRHRAVSRLSVDRKHDAPFHPFVEFISKFNPRTSDRDCHWSLLFVFRHYRVSNRLATSGRLRILPQLSLAATI